MKFWILKNENALAVKLERYPAAAESLGFDVEVVDVAQITSITADENGFSLVKDGKQIQKKDYPDAVIVICRTFGTIHLDFWSAELVQHLEMAEVVVGNSFSSIQLADNKWLTHQKLVALGITTPATTLLSREENQAAVLGKVTYPLILKTVFGSKGQGVFLCANQAEVMQNIAEIEPQKTVLIQEYLPTTHGKDIRALVVGDTVIAAMKRTAAEDGFKANLGADGQGEVINLSEEQKQLAIDATKALGLYYSGVDLLFRSDDELTVGEVNANPGLGIEMVTGVNVAEAICAYLAELVAKKRNA